jgi:alpha/beta superfamily hydrolase
LGDSRSMWIPGPAGKLEAALRLAEPARALAVVAHPHPSHGGTLHNPVVFHCDRELNRLGLTTLRFNFRGVGASEGTYDRGEGEVDDAAAAVGWLSGLSREVPLLVVGYSFGAWCTSRHAIDNPRVAAMIAIGMPVEHYDFGLLREFGRPVFAVHGADDELASPDEVRAILRELRPEGELRIVDGATHLFPGRADDVAAEVVAAAEALLL